MRSHILFKTMTVLVGLLLFVFLTGDNAMANQEEGQDFSALAQGVTEFNQAPMLEEMVAEGELPPLEERLPSDPIVVYPVEKIGEYGGTWNRVHMEDEMGPWKATALWAGEGLFKWPRHSLKYLIPNLATFEWNESKTKVTFHLKEGVKWSDGEPLTVDDFLFWWEDMVLDERVPLNPTVGTFVAGEPMEVTKIDDYTMEFEYSETYPFALKSFNRFNDYWSIVPAHYMKQFHPEYNADLADEETQKLMDRFDNRHQYPDMPTYTAWRPVQWEAGKRAVFERNPYYWKVDAEGNQLPYIDRVVSRRVEDMEMQVVRAVEGEIDFQARNWNMSDIPLLKEKEEQGDYRIIMWDRGDSAWPMLIPGYDHPDENIRDIMFNVNFRRALSFSIDRDRINEIVSLDLAEPHVSPITELTVVPTAEGQQVYEEWESSWTGHQVEKAKELLDEMGMVDADGDGWRERPDGEDFRLTVIAGVNETMTIDALDLIREDWEEIGINMVIDTLSPTELQNRRLAGEYMMQAWSSSTACSLFMAAAHWIPVRYVSYALHPLAARYYQTKGEKGIPPRTDYFKKMQDLYNEAMFTADDEKRYSLEVELYRMHLKYGPLMFSTLGNHPAPVLIKNNFHNVSKRGILAAWSWNYPATAGIEQFYIEQ